MINVSNLTFAWNEKPLFEKACFTVGKGQKAGLVGPNGSGKTTLFGLLTQKESPDGGNVEITGKVGMVPQEVKRDLEMENASSVRQYLDPESAKEDHLLVKMLAGLELGNLELSGSPRNLSGGQKTKLALARALLSQPEVLLLDEPTNFMDIEGKRWVMNFLSHYKGTLILISHDLNLMDSAIDKVLAINPAERKIEEYKGNYSKFVKLKKEKDALVKRQVLAEEKHIKNMEEGLKKLYRFTSKKGVRARVMLERRIDKAKEALPDLPKEIRSIKVKLPEPANVGELPVRIIDVSKSYGSHKVLDKVSLAVKRGERIALIGPNGAGKSTLIKIITGMLEADSGEVIRNDKLKIGYYSQEFENFDLKKTLVETFVDDTNKGEDFARPFLGRYMFLGNKVFQRVETLSGGEKTRLAIALLTGHDYNLMILDEPTTYLDVTSQRIILEALKEYKGAMIVVSHTREFIEELNPSRVLILPENRLTFWSEDILTMIEEI